MKRIISMILVFIVMFSLSTPIFAQNEYVEKLESKGLIKKFDNGTYGLDKTITRGEVVEVAIKMLGLQYEIPQESKEIYLDIPKDSYLEDYIKIATQKELVSGYSNGKFEPNKEITYAEFITIIVRALKGQASENRWPENYIEKAIEMKLIDNIENPYKLIIREEAYNIIYKVIDKLRTKVVMVTDLGGIKDGSFNESAWKGFNRAKEEFDIDISYIEPANDLYFNSSFETVNSNNNDLIFGIGFMLGEPILEQAQLNKGHKYVIVDTTIEEIPENLTCILFKHEEASFLAGYIAGKMTKTNKIGFVGGFEVELVDQFRYGYEAGALYANQDVKIVSQYTETFSDANKGKELANKMYKDNVDIIFHAAGGAGDGVIESAKENNKYVIGVDRDQSHLAPNHVLTSAVKNIENAVESVIKDYMEGNFKGGQEVYYSIKENGVGLAQSTNKLVPKEILEEIDKVKEEISNKKIIVPKNYDEFLKFKNSI
ncbi:BMP family ABC transporter substrate-binding protein [Tissierella carlieri]|uniref:BMP family ABC transporter substrate-binding protein n=1 Tax=Tissierella carlieri TaxID=689904 RepID=A0ABT1SGQ5_9FIRM|nr:BMP family ABC transporter substrate-binding protein [Tissierella carlieri]MCQ4925671.1 BMP family ABC transporter substrate-binding protein [Tissierella carlieri]